MKDFPRAMYFFEPNINQPRINKMIMEAGGMTSAVKYGLSSASIGSLVLSAGSSVRYQSEVSIKEKASVGRLFCV